MDALRGDAENGILGFTVTITGKLTVNHRYGLEVWGVLLKALQSGSRLGLELGLEQSLCAVCIAGSASVRLRRGRKRPWEQGGGPGGVRWPLSGL
jgi:hypothetical protein